MAKKSDARRITTKFPSKCKSCGTELPKGTKVLWYPGGTIYGLECHPNPFASAKPKQAAPKTSPPKAAVQTTKKNDLDALAQQFLNLLKQMK